ncbi:putative endolysin [Acinetobacter phage P577]|uniref:endolysin n=1 Tax=Acinetobacter phage YMC13/03/R2096 TaxID=1560342 RepID=UPI00052AE93D|nr:endolysin [Acinetobacter phage YMC13/03/R2096]AIW02769.1 putative endolysin [Acinetobacter phage YMC13/03/R2096]WNT46260.1 putative endolysin [Acinetobacter phage P577]
MSSLMCMALVIFSEARGEPLKGKQAVAEVVATRSIEWNKDVCGVIYQKGQFTGIRNVKPPKEGTPARKEWEDCHAIAKKYVHDEKAVTKYKVKRPTNFTNRALYFNRGSSCSNGNYKITKIGNHVFCR